MVYAIEMKRARTIFAARLSIQKLLIRRHLDPSAISTSTTMSLP